MSSHNSNYDSHGSDKHSGNSVLQAIKDVNHRVFGGYAELLRLPHSARFAIGSVIACMPFPMIGMTITISGWPAHSPPCKRSRWPF